ncbi:hypothetical protein OGAPHI_003107 [Ogataea philodendri]|uniref:Uncharacterized protein n=1 Tax=Ogataea philodendri TaxID=1378263 RepID=A0A9P8T5X1_9ASCO|nr:uncharacterized protein OGAPHI_003107 [Ogataea philodendri]KAH3667458.1 hypothetical protein OGAPHI_003107 [Ogataea philodendri]
MALDWLRDVSGLGIELDVSDDSAVFLGNTAEGKPGQVVVCHKHGELTIGQGDVSCSQEDRSVFRAVEHVPGERGRSCDQTDGGLVQPAPEYHRLTHNVGLESLLGGEVENLESCTVCPQCNDVLRRVHDDGVGSHRLSGDLVVVFQVDNGDRVARIRGFPTANIVVRLQSCGHKVEGLRGNAQRGQLTNVNKINWRVFCHSPSLNPIKFEYVMSNGWKIQGLLMICLFAVNS